MSKVKQVIVMRKDLKMRRGKEIAQGAHASMAVLLDMMEIQYLSNVGIGVGEENDFSNVCGGQRRILETLEKTPLYEWLTGRFTKICVSCESEEQLLKLYEEAKDNKIPTALITDAGLTEFDGVPTNTCIAIGPYWSEDIDKITGKLKLL
jgi:PTH2 family peptidyl-tRNA hydrolase